MRSSLRYLQGQQLQEGARSFGGGRGGRARRRRRGGRGGAGGTRSRCSSSRCRGGGRCATCGASACARACATQRRYASRNLGHSTMETTMDAT